MPLTKIGINISGLNNITVPTFTFKNTTAEFLEDIPAKANEVTQGYYGLIVLVGLLTYLWWLFQRADIDGGSYNYDTFRSIALASSVCSVLGLFSINMGLFVNFYHVVIFIIIAFISTGVVWKTTQ